MQGYVGHGEGRDPSVSRQATALDAPSNRIDDSSAIDTYLYV